MTERTRHKTVVEDHNAHLTITSTDKSILAKPAESTSDDIFPKNNRPFIHPVSINRTFVVSKGQLNDVKKDVIPKSIIPPTFSSQLINKIPVNFPASQLNPTSADIFSKSDLSYDAPSSKVEEPFNSFPTASTPLYQSNSTNATTPIINDTTLNTPDTTPIMNDTTSNTTDTTPIIIDTRSNTTDTTPNTTDTTPNTTDATSNTTGAPSNNATSNMIDPPTTSSDTTSTLTTTNATDTPVTDNITLTYSTLTLNETNTTFNTTNTLLNSTESLMTGNASLEINDVITNQSLPSLIPEQVTYIPLNQTNFESHQPVNAYDTLPSLLTNQSDIISYSNNSIGLLTNSLTTNQTLDKAINGTDMTSSFQTNQSNSDPLVASWRQYFPSFFSSSKNTNQENSQLRADQGKSQYDVTGPVNPGQTQEIKIGKYLRKVVKPWYI